MNIESLNTAYLILLMFLNIQLPTYTMHNQKIESQTEQTTHNNQSECPICKEDISPEGALEEIAAPSEWLSCTHPTLFHHSCLKTALTINYLCPICRTKTTFEEFLVQKQENNTSSINTLENANSSLMIATLTNDIERIRTLIALNNSFIL
jgi:transcription initiation factor IIE alpha subunit